MKRENKIKSIVNNLDKCIEFNHEIGGVLFPLLKGFYPPFGICCLYFVTESCLDFFHEIVPILDS